MTKVFATFTPTEGPVELVVQGQARLDPPALGDESWSWRWRKPGGNPKVVDGGRYRFVEEGEFDLWVEVTAPRFGTLWSQPVKVRAKGMSSVAPPEATARPLAGAVEPPEPPAKGKTPHVEKVSIRAR